MRMHSSFARYLSLLIVTALLLAVAGCGSAPATSSNAQNPSAPASTPAAPSTNANDPFAGEPILLKIHSNHGSPPASAGEAVQFFADEVTKRTNGKVQFEIYWSNALAQPAESLELGSTGVVDILCSCAMYWPGKFPINHFEFTFPFGPIDSELIVAAKRQMYDEFPQIADQWTKYNMKFLGGITWSYYEILSKKPIRTLADFKGEKVGLIGRWFGSWFEPLGAVPVVCGAADRYVNLQSGVQTMDLLGVDMQYSYSLHEQAKYLIMIDAGSYIPNDLVMNLDSYNKLDPAIQKIIDEVALEMEVHTAKYIKKIKDESIQKMKEAGVTVIDFPKEDIDKWVDMLPDIPASFAQEMEDAGMPGWEIQKRWIEITTQMGHKWAREWAVKPK